MKFKFGLIGHQISYSLSPKIHSEVGHILNQRLAYELLDISKEDLSSYIEKLKKGEFQGFNITKPYKESFFDDIDVLSKVAEETKAVNTIYSKDGKIYGDNTDVFGFSYLLDYYQIDIKDKKVLILGTGGASKACGYVCKHRGANYMYASRDKSKKMDKKVISYDEIYPDDYDIYINATPIGTTPLVEQSVLKPEQVTNQIVIDLIYRPKVTKLMSYAKKSYNGYIMLLAQAIKSDMLWMKRDINIHDVLDKVKEVISYE